MATFQNFDDSYKLIYEFYNSLQNKIAIDRKINPPSAMLVMTITVNDIEFTVTSHNNIKEIFVATGMEPVLIDKIISTKFQLFEKTLFKDPAFNKNGKYWQILIEIKPKK